MSGSWLGRIRIGRLAVCGILLFLLVSAGYLAHLYLDKDYRIERLEMRNAKCIQEQEFLSKQFDMVLEHKLRLDKELSDEKSANVAAKQELEERSNREREKELEAEERFKALQLNYNLLETNHNDLRGDYTKLQNKSIEQIKNLEATIADLKQQLARAAEEKTRSVENLKTQYLEIEAEKKAFEDKYNRLIANAGNINSTIDHLHKENMQLQRELDESKKHKHFVVSGVASVPSSQVSPRQVKPEDALHHQRPGVPGDRVGIQLPQPARQQPSTSKSPGISVSPSVSSPSAHLVAAPPVKRPPRVRLPAGVVPIPKMRENFYNNNNKNDPMNNIYQIKPAGRAPPDQAPAAKHDGMPLNKLREQFNRVQGIDRPHKLQQGIQEIGENNNVEKINDFGGDNNDDGPEGHYDEYYKGPHNKPEGNHADPDQDDDYQFDYGGRNMNFNAH